MSVRRDIAAERAARKTPGWPPVPAWLPDWRSLDRYPSETASINRFRWEFLRRNPHYWLLWDYHIRPFLMPNGGYDAEAAEASPWHRYHSTIAYRFGVTEAPPPERDDLHPFFGARDSWGDVRRVGSGKHGIPAGTPRPDEIFLKISLRRDTDRQLERAKPHLRRWAEKSGFLRTTRPRRALYPNYLRILDAYAQETSPREIAAVLFPNEDNSVENNFIVSKRIENNYASAVKIRNGGYKYL